MPNYHYRRSKSVFCIKISVMTFFESGKEYKSIRSYKGLNFRDGCLTFGVPLWHDLCSSSPNISRVNLTICLWNYNLPSCWLAEEKHSKQWHFSFVFKDVTAEQKQGSTIFSGGKNKLSFCYFNEGSCKLELIIRYGFLPNKSLERLEMSLLQNVRQRGDSALCFRPSS